MKYIIVVKDSGEMNVHSYEPNHNITLEEWQGYFGGNNIETVPSVFPGIEILIDEEGKLKGLPVNAIATGLVHPSVADVLVGDAVLVSVKKNNLDGMNEKAMEFITGRVLEAVLEAEKEVRDV